MGVVICTAASRWRKRKARKENADFADTIKKELPELQDAIKRELGELGSKKESR
jgi:hypothetical protein